MIKLFVCQSIFSKLPIQCLQIEFCISSETFSKSRSTTLALVSSKGALRGASCHKYYMIYSTDFKIYIYIHINIYSTSLTYTPHHTGCFFTGPPLNIARGTTDPEIDSETWTKLGNNMALIGNLH